MLQVLSAEKWRERDVHLSIFGTGPYGRVQKSLAQTYGLNNVSFEGFTNDVESIWRRHHALMLPSRLEGLPLVVVEAMHMGRPCVVTDVHGNAEVIEDNVSGWVAAAAVPKYFDEALERAWQRRSEWRQVGEKAREAIHRLIPEDPAGAFAQRLVEMVSG